MSEEGVTYQGVEKWRIIQIRDRPIGRWCFVIEFQGSTDTAFCRFDIGEGRNKQDWSISSSVKFMSSRYCQVTNDNKCR